MSYTLATPTPSITNLETFVQQIVDAQTSLVLTPKGAEDLIAGGQVVNLTPTPALIDGTTSFPVWGSCMEVHKAGSDTVGFFALLLALKPGTSEVWTMPNGYPVSTQIMHNMPMSTIAQNTLHAIKKAVLVFLLGEGQTPPIIEDASNAIMSNVTISIFANAAIRFSQSAPSPL